MGPKYVATEEKKNKKVCTLHYSLCLSVEKNTSTNICIYIFSTIVMSYY